jgi:hypothetical protein
MRHARSRSTLGRNLVVTVMLGSLAGALAACSGTAAAPVTTPVPVTTAANAAPRVTPAPTTPAPTATPERTSQIVMVTPPPAPSVFKSPLYGYTIDLPAGAEVTDVRPATDRWDGTATINSDGPLVDRFSRTGSRLAIILAAPTNLDLDAYQAAVHAKAVTEHGCPEEVARERDFAINGTPAKVVAFVCGGLQVYEATIVRDGMGLIAKQLTPPPGSPALETASLDDFISFLEALKWGG